MILLTGGSGALGAEIKKLLPVFAPTREEFDITDPWQVSAELIIHAAAYTAVNQAEEEKKLCYETNVLGTRKLSMLCIPMLYISTDSVFDGSQGNYSENDIPYPKNFYSLTKLIGEYEVQDGVILRCSPKARPWGRESACTDRFFSAEYADQTAKKVVKAVRMFKKLPRTLHIGSKRRSHYEMAKETRPDVSPVEISDYGVYRGRDTSLNCGLWERLK